VAPIGTTATFLFRTLLKFPSYFRFIFLACVVTFVVLCWRSPYEIGVDTVRAWVPDTHLLYRTAYICYQSVLCRARV